MQRRKLETINVILDYSSPTGGQLGFSGGKLHSVLSRSFTPQGKCLFLQPNRELAQIDDHIIWRRQDFATELQFSLIQDIYAVGNWGSDTTKVGNEEKKGWEPFS